MAVNPIPPGYGTVTPYLTVQGAAKLLDFVQGAFGAVVTENMQAPDGKVMHAEVRIGDSMVMMGEAGGAWKPMQSLLYLYVPDVDAAYKKAVAAGGESMQEPTNQFYGDRNASVKDPTGNIWSMATHVEDVPKDEMERRAQKYMQEKAKA